MSSIGQDLDQVSTSPGKKKRKRRSNTGDELMIGREGGPSMSWEGLFGEEEGPVGSGSRRRGWYSDADATPTSSPAPIDGYLAQGPGDRKAVERYGNGWDGALSFLRDRFGSVNPAMIRAVNSTYGGPQEGQGGGDSPIGGGRWGQRYFNEPQSRLDYLANSQYPGSQTLSGHPGYNRGPGRLPQVLQDRSNQGADAYRMEGLRQRFPSPLVDNGSNMLDQTYARDADARRLESFMDTIRPAPRAPAAWAAAPSQPYPGRSVNLDRLYRSGSELEDY